MSLTKFNQTYKPFKYAWAMELSANHELIHWVPEEIKLGEDVEQWKSGIITDSEKINLIQILRIFTQSDVVVSCSYSDIFIPRFKNNEIRAMLLSFAARESIHFRSYSLISDTLGLPDTEYSKFLEFKEMKEKIEFMQQFDNSTVSGLGLSIAKTVCNEGVMLFGSFIALLNYQRFGKMKNTNLIVNMSIKDETEHCIGMTKLFLEYCKEHPKIVNDEFKSSIYKIFSQAVEVEDASIDLTFSNGEQRDLKKDDIKKYIRYLANRRLTGLGLKEIFDVKENPLEWVDWILANDSHTNFFELTSIEYSVDNLSGDWGW